MSYIGASYKTPGPVAYPDERWAPVPGWGMRPEMAGPRVIGIGGLGYDLPIKTPIGTQTISVPIEAMMTDTINAAWPQVRNKLMAEVPGILDMAVTKARDKAVSDLWPTLQPKLRKEVDYAIMEARTVAVVVGLGVIGSVFLSSALLKRSLSR